MTENPILMRDIANRDVARSIKPTVDRMKQVNTNLYSTITRPINDITAEEFMVQSCITRESIEINYMDCFKIFIELVEQDIAKNGLYYSKVDKLATFLIQNVISVLPVDSLINLNNFLKDTNYSQPIYDRHRTAFLDSIKKIQTLNRVLDNNDKINTRFDIDKFARENRNNDEIVEEICKLIDTYSMPLEFKYNIAIENTQYTLYKNGIKKTSSEILEGVNNYFLTRNNVIIDEEYKGLAKVLKINKFITEADILNSSSKYIIEKSETLYYSTMITKLANQCKSKDVSNLIYTIGKIRTEKHASAYIEKVYTILENNKYLLQDKMAAYSSIYYIPLISSVSKDFIISELAILNEKIFSTNNLTTQDKDNLRDIDEELKNDITLYAESYRLYSSVDNSDSIFNENYVEPELSATEYLQRLNEEVSDDEEIKELIKKFKTEQDKNPNKFKVLLNKVFSKSPECLIDNAPSLLYMIRYAFVLSSAAIPTVGPVVAALGIVINRVLDVSIGMNQAKKLYRYLKEEEKKVSDKIDNEDDQDTLKKLNMYHDKLNKCIDNVGEYITNIDDDDEDVYGGNDYDDGDSNDFDFDFESAKIISASEFINEMSSIDYDNLKCKMEANIHTILNEDDSFEFAKLISNTNDKIISDYMNILEEYKNREDCTYVESERISCIKNRIYSYKVESSTLIDELYITHESINLLDEILTEDSKNNDKKKTPRAIPFIKDGKLDMTSIKLAIVDIKRKAKELNAKQKQACVNLDMNVNRFIDGVNKALTNDRREAIIKGSIIPSFSKCISAGLIAGGAYLVNPTLGVITAFGMFATSKYLNAKEKALLYDEIEVELQVVDKKIQQAESEGNMNEYRFLLTYQRKLIRERQRIKYGIKSTTKRIASTPNNNNNSY